VEALAPRVVHAQENDEQCADEKDQVEEEAERVHDEHPVEDPAPEAVQARRLPGHEQESPDDPEEPDPEGQQRATGGLVLVGGATREEVRHERQEPRRREGQQRQQARQARRGHQRLSA
jgi:hypothetical protein